MQGDLIKEDKECVNGSLMAIPKTEVQVVMPSSCDLDLNSPHATQSCKEAACGIPLLGCATSDTGVAMCLDKLQICYGTPSSNGVEMQMAPTILTIVELEGPCAKKGLVKGRSIQVRHGVDNVEALTCMSWLGVGKMTTMLIWESVRINQGMTLLWTVAWINHDTCDMALLWIIA
ncbi:hypothetical protein VNO78_03820 [Psophocarpus tetragonolobus]|uniref:Uncharacterized protein n=1 Tax=Psophocarpus tetragonolobus TaxID=3891 RepID=A0AAN9XVW9_PSOTE